MKEHCLARPERSGGIEAFGAALRSRLERLAAANSVENPVEKCQKHLQNRRKKCRKNCQKVTFGAVKKWQKNWKILGDF